MSIDRVATTSQTNYMLTQISKANAKLDQSTKEVASGKVSDTYAGIGSKTASLEGARVAVQRATAYQANTQIALTQSDLQNTQLTTLSGLASQLETAVEKASGNSDGTGLMETANSIFQQASNILNATDANGNYIYGGSLTDQKPFTATSLSDLSSDTVSSFFKNDDYKKTVQVGDGQTQTVGVVASDIGTKLMTALQDLYNVDGGTGSLNGQLSTSQADNLSTQVMPDAKSATTELNSITGSNGDTYTALKTAISDQSSLNTLYTGFVSDIEDADMGQALTNLTANQTALQAVLTVTSKLNDMSLLNYLPTS